MIVVWIPSERGLARLEVGEGPIPSNAVWVDIMDMTSEEKQRVEALGIELPSRAEMQEIEASSRLYREGDASYMTATMLIKTETPAPESTAVTFILTRTLLISLRYDEPWTFRIFPQRAAKCGAQTSEQAFAAILDTTIERLADLLELVSVELEHISQQVFRRHQGKRAGNMDLQRAIQSIGRCGNIAGKVRESLLDKMRMLTFAEQSTHEWMTAENRLRVQSLERDIQSLSDHATFTGSKISFLLDATLGLINNNVNQEMQRMNAIMIAFMWPTMVSGFFAMNVRLPFPTELSWPFYLCIFLAFAPLVVGFMWWWRTKRR